jgi:hypothetical protein
MKSPLRTYKKTFYFLLWGGWGLTEGQSPPRFIVGGRHTVYRSGGGKLMEIVFVLSSAVLLFGGQPRGGGEVSGWGTLYMKWGAGRSSTSRVLKARAGEKLTHTYISTHISPLTQLFYLLKIPKKSAKILWILGVNTPFLPVFPSLFLFRYNIKYFIFILFLIL